VEVCIYCGISVGGWIANDKSDNFAPNLYWTEDFVICAVVGYYVVFVSHFWSLNVIDTVSAKCRVWALCDKSFVPE
jgi:hypothetical protein